MRDGLTPEWPRFAVRLGTHARWGTIAVASTRGAERRKIGVWIPRLPGASIESVVRVAHAKLALLVEQAGPIDSTDWREFTPAGASRPWRYRIVGSRVEFEQAALSKLAELRREGRLAVRGHGLDQYQWADAGDLLGWLLAPSPAAENGWHGVDAR